MGRSKKIILWSAVAVVAVVVLFALTKLFSSGSLSTEAARAQIAQFRELMAKEQYNQIYAEASDSFRKSATEQDVVRLLTAVNGKLGAVKSTESNGWNMNFTPSGSFITLPLKTQFERGTGVEIFVYRIADGRALLAGYTINSNALITN